MNTRIGLVITAVAGAAAIIYSRWKQRAARINAKERDHTQSSNLYNPPKWYKQIKNLPEIDGTRMVALRYANPSASSAGNDLAQVVNKNVPYYHKGKRHH